MFIVSNVNLSLSSGEKNMTKHCPMCGNTTVDENARFCAKCGGELSQISVPQTQTAEPTGNKLKEAGKWIAICCGGAIFCVIIAAFVYGMVGSTSSISKAPILSIEEIKSQSQNIPYNSLMRNPDNYKNAIVKFRGKVVQIQQIYGDKYMLRISTKQQEYLGYFDDTIYVNYNGNRLVEGDIVDVWGNFVGLKSYTAVLGNEITIPEFNALNVEIVKAKT